MVSSEEVFEQAKIFLPKYLTPDQQKQLFEELDSFPENQQFYLNPEQFPNEMLQGDGWSGFLAINFKTLEQKTVSGIVLSNTCDISANNERRLPVNISFAPIISLSKYINCLRVAGQSEPKIENMLIEIRRQHTTQIFYLPECSGVVGESIVVFDNIHTHPRDAFLESTNSKIFTLNQLAFYVFLMKLSIHFCRFNEGISRFKNQ